MTLRVDGSCPDPSTAPTTDDHLRAATGAREGASASHHGHDHDPVEHAAHLGVETVGVGAEYVGETLSGGGVAGLGFLGEVGGMIGHVAGAWTTWVSGPIEGQRRGLEYDSEMMRGCLAAFEGRADDEDVRATAAASPGFANGIRDAERLALRNPDLFACVRAAIVAANGAGESAVYAGADAGPEFDARYETDLAFRHGVDRARTLRAADPAAFEAAARESGALWSAVDDGRLATTVRA